MTERSRPWDGTTTGDASEAPYDAATEWGRLFRACHGAAEQSAHKGGVLIGASGFGDYAATSPSANTVRIASGIGWDQGTWHESDANVDFTISTPATQTRVDRIVLRKSWASQTVRLTRIAGTEGAGLPALTQVYGTTWDVPLWQVSITTGAAITLTSDRVSLLVAQHTHADALQGGTASGISIAHTALTGVTADQHHAQSHVHLSDGSGTVAHSSTSGSGSNTHTQIDTHIAGQAAVVHNIQRFNTNGTQSMGTPTDGKMVYARANGGVLNVTTPSGSIFRGLEGGVSSMAIPSGDSFTLIADGTNWHVF